MAIVICAISVLTVVYIWCIEWFAGVGGCAGGNPSWGGAPGNGAHTSKPLFSCGSNISFDEIAEQSGCYDSELIFP